MADKHFGFRLKKAREAKKLTQAEVCKPENANIPKVQTLSAYERGVNSPPLDTLKRLAVLYEVSADWLLFGEDAGPTISKSNIDYVIQLVSAIDRLKLKISVDSRLPANSWAGSNDTCYVVTLSTESPFEEQIIPYRFTQKWGKLRDLLDSGIIDCEEYDTLIAQRIQELLSGKLNDAEPLPV